MIHILYRALRRWKIYRRRRKAIGMFEITVVGIDSNYSYIIIIIFFFFNFIR